MDKESATKNERQNEQARGPAARPARKTGIVEWGREAMTEEIRKCHQNPYR